MVRCGGGGSIPSSRSLIGCHLEAPIHTALESSRLDITSGLLLSHSQHLGWLLRLNLNLFTLGASTSVMRPSRSSQLAIGASKRRPRPSPSRVGVFEFELRPLPPSYSFMKHPERAPSNPNPRPRAHRLDDLRLASSSRLRSRKPSCCTV